MKNKLLSAFIILFLLIQMVMPAMAVATIAEQTDVLKQLFKIPDKAHLQRESDSGEAMVSWYLDGGDFFGQAVFNEENEELLSYIEVYEAPKLAIDMTMAECQKYVENVITRMLPEKRVGVSLTAGPERYSEEGSTLYHFNYERVEGQIPVRGDGIYFIFNATTGRIVMMQLSWFNGTLPDRSEVMSAQEAGTVFSQGVPLQLEWLKTAKGLGDLKFELKPVYRMADDYAINAKTGQDVSAFQTEILPAVFDPGSRPVNLAPVGPDAAITMAQAESQARKAAQVPAGFTTAESYTLWTWGEQGRTREFIFTDSEQEKETYVSVDVVTGQVKGINNYTYFYSEDKPKFTYNTGLDKAQFFGRSLAPGEFAQTKINGKEPDYVYPAYDFVRYIYGIPYKENGIQVELNEYTGELSGYYLIWERNLNIANLTAIIDEPGMRQILGENAGMRMVYMVSRDLDSESSDVTEEVQLVYEPENSMLGTYDAVTGVKVEQSRIPPGTAGHWSESSFRSLAEKGIVNPSAAINPNKPITRADFTKMLVLATYLYPKQAKASVFGDVGLSSPYLGYIEQAYARGVVKGSSGKFYPDRPIARQEVAVILMKALKSEGRIATDTKIENSSFKDKGQIGSWAANDVNLATQLGYIKGFNGYFRPTSNITWGEAAALLNSYINNV